MGTGNNGNKSVWRRRDASYREQERARRAANAQRRLEVALATADGISVDEWRRLKAESDA
jgi:hypothetical protein